MNAGSIVIAGAAALLLVSAAGAAEPPPLTSAAATWAESGLVELTFTYDGGACEAPGVPEVTGSDLFGTDVVTVPTATTAEVCTMQIVPVEFSGTIPVEPTTETLSIVVLDPEGQPKAAGTVEIETAAD